MWVIYYRRHLPTFGNNTNNRMERFWGSLKNVTNRYKNFKHLLNSIRTVEENLNLNLAYKDHDSKLKSRVNTEIPDLFQFLKHGITDYALSMCLQHFSDYSDGKLTKGEYLLCQSNDNKDENIKTIISIKENKSKEFYKINLENLTCE